MAKKKPIPKRKNVGQTASIKDFIDMVVSGVIKFNPDHYIVGDTYRSVWAIREYPPATSEQAILSRFGDRESVTLRIYSRYVDAREQERIIQNAARKNKMMLGGDNMQESIAAESNLEDVATLLKEMARNLEPLLHCSCYESGKNILCLDAEQEYEDLCNNLGGCYIDLMTGKYIINPLEPKAWSDDEDDTEVDSPEAFRKATRLSQHISYLKDFFRAYKDFTDAHIDAIEIMATKLYEQRGITDTTDFSRLTPEDYPIMSDLYDIVEAEYKCYLRCVRCQRLNGFQP